MRIALPVPTSARVEMLMRRPASAEFTTESVAASLVTVPDALLAVQV